MTDEQLDLIDHVIDTLVRKLEPIAKDCVKIHNDAMFDSFQTEAQTTYVANVADGLYAIATALQNIADKMPDAKKPKFEVDPDEQDPMGLKRKGGRSWNN